MSNPAARQHPRIVALLPPPLPRAVVPVPRETTDSYLRRLAAANHVEPGDLLEHLCTPAPRSLRHLTIAGLAAASGQLPERIARLHRSAPGERTRYLNGGFTQIRLACRRCAAHRGRLGEPLCHFPDYLTVCQRHQLWIGPGVTTHAEQYDLSELPAVLAAQRRHHRLFLHHAPHLVACFRHSQEKIWRNRIRYADGLTDDQRHRLAHLEPAMAADQNPAIPYAQLRSAALAISTYPEVIRGLERTLTRIGPTRERWHPPA